MTEKPRVATTHALPDKAPAADRGCRDLKRNDRVFVSHRLAHRLAPQPQPNGLPYSPLQRIPAGWQGRYICPAIRWDVYDAATDTLTPRDIHLVEDPAGRLRRALLEDMTPIDVLLEETEE